MTEVFSKVDIEERKLESEIIKNPEYIEKGLIVLDHQFPTGNGFIDILCVDDNKTLAIMELKIREDDYMLMQILEYFDWINENKDRIAERYKELKNIEIDKEEIPRIILVAPSFSTTLIKSIKYIDATVDIFEFEYLQTSNNSRGLLFRHIENEPVRITSLPITYDEHIDYIKNNDVKELCKETINKIKSIDESNIEVKTTKNNIVVKVHGRNISVISTKRDFFWLGYYIEDSENKDLLKWEWKKISKIEEFSQEILNDIVKRYNEENEETVDKK